MNLSRSMLMGTLMCGLALAGCLSTAQVDADGDGYTTEQGDCDDSSPGVNAAASEVCDGVDNNCDGDVDEADADDAVVWYVDLDGDGYGAESSPGSVRACSAPVGYVENHTDCNDADASIHPDASEQCDGIDTNCNDKPDDGFDDDLDGYTSCQNDCDDHNAAIHPNAAELCRDSFDNNCDGQINEGCDEDEDGYTSFEGDCDDTDPDVNPDAIEICGDELDNNCDGETDSDTDADADGYTSCGGDCNDAKANINPDAAEVCDGVDNNCDGLMDDGFDADADGYTTCRGDCNDADPDTYSGAEETCNGLDDDCDGDVDEELTLDYFPDDDGDGYGDIQAAPASSCGQPTGYVTDSTDCDDGDAGVHPGEREICDTKDNDCNGEVDDAFWQGSGIPGLCGIHVMLPSQGAMAIPSGYKIQIDFDSKDPANPGSQPYAITDSNYLWLTLTGSDGSVMENNSTRQDFGSPTRNADVPTRISWPNGLEMASGVTYTLEVMECQNKCSDPGNGWIIKGKATFSSQAPCGIAFDTKTGMEILQLGSTPEVTLDGMNWDIANSSDELGLYLMNVSPSDTFPIADLEIGYGPLNSPSPYQISSEWGVPMVMSGAGIDDYGAFVTPERDLELAVPMSVGTFMLYVQDAVNTATLSISGGAINSLSDYRMTGYVHQDDMHKLLVDADLTALEPQIRYDVDADGDGDNDTATMVIKATPVYLSSITGMDTSCLE